MTHILQQKYNQLCQFFASSQSPRHSAFVLAYSGGLDSRFLLSVASRHAAQVIPVLAVGLHVSAFESKYAKKTLLEQNISLTEIFFDVFAYKDICANTRERCYFCKKALFTAILQSVPAMAVPGAMLIDGTNASDLLEYRPGIRALHELGVVSPMAQLGITKDDIRQLAAQHQLPDPAQKSKPCLLTRFAYGVEPTREQLMHIALLENAMETALVSAGITDFRLRVGADMQYFLQLEGAYNATQEKMCQNVMESLGFSGIPVVFTEKLSGYFDNLGQV